MTEDYDILKPFCSKFVVVLLSLQSKWQKDETRTRFRGMQLKHPELFCRTLLQLSQHRYRGNSNTQSAESVIGTMHVVVKVS